MSPTKLFILAAALLPNVLAAQERPARAERLGTVAFETSCTAAAQPMFTRGVTQLHSFGFGAATASFQEALKADPNCAIAYWGIALTAWANPFAAGLKAPAALQRGLDAVQAARAISGGTPRERDYVAAAAKLYENFANIDQRTRLLAYRDAMAALAAKYPNDIEAKIFYALSLAISSDPADKSYASLLQSGQLLEGMVKSYPDHPGLAHYIIHAYDVPPLASRAVEAAHAYATIAPSASHALHMPSHTYTRVGSWQESIESNRASATSARAEGSVAEELHALDYMTYAHLQQGQDRAAQEVLAGLPEVQRRFEAGAGAGAAPPSAGVFALAAVPARYALERGRWSDAARLEARSTVIPYADAITHFARAIGAARTGNTTIPRAAVAELERLRGQLEGAREAYWTEQVEIQRRGASAWLAFAEGRREDALTAMRAAADMEDATEKNAVTPGPIAPARELVGEMLMEMNRPADALVEFERTLGKEPNRFRALAGAMRAAAAAGDRAKARTHAAQLLAIAADGDQPGRTEVAEARRLAGG
jgi:hypothetical protein